MKIWSAALIFFVLMLANARAEEGDTPADAPGATPERVKVIMKKSETLKFGGLKLKGHVKKPDLSYIYQRKGIRSEQIVNVPQDFNDELIRDASRF